MLREYASCIDLPVEEARKELEIKLESRYYTVLKIQGHVDYLIKKVNKTSSVKEILEYYDITKYRMMGNYV
jgi:hydroxymethylpyrimidine pyrophosphatase-like HAD family hydrolase